MSSYTRIQLSITLTYHYHRWSIFTLEATYSVDRWAHVGSAAEAANRKDHIGQRSVKLK